MIYLIMAQVVQWIVIIHLLNKKESIQKNILRICDVLAEITKR